MKIETGNVIDAFEEYRKTGIACLIHVVNCQGIMGSGIAKEIKERYPNVAKSYFEARACGDLRLGENIINDYVVNMPAQNYYGGSRRNLDYGAFAACVFDVAQRINIRKTQGEKFKVFTPYLIGCDRAGGDWDVVSEILDFAFGDSIICYKLN